MAAGISAPNCSRKYNQEMRFRMNPYYEQMILNAEPVELIRLLYQRAISCVRDAREHLAHKRIAERSKADHAGVRGNRATDRRPASGRRSRVVFTPPGSLRLHAAAAPGCEHATGGRPDGGSAGAFDDAGRGMVRCGGTDEPARLGSVPAAGRALDSGRSGAGDGFELRGQRLNPDFRSGFPRPFCGESRRDQFLQTEAARRGHRFCEFLLAEAEGRRTGTVIAGSEPARVFFARRSKYLIDQQRLEILRGAALFLFLQHSPDHAPKCRSAIPHKVFRHSSNHLKFGIERARRPQILQNRDDVARGRSDCRQCAYQFFDGRALFQHHVFRSFLSRRHGFACGTTSVLPCDNESGCETSRFV